jgi:uncharacterized protein (DUF983 family)
MKALRDIGSGVLVSALFIAFTTVLPIGAAIAVVVPFMVLLALAEIGEQRGEREARWRMARRTR